MLVGTLGIHRNDDGFAIPSLTHFMGQVLIPKKHDLPRMPLGSQSVGQYGIIGAAPDRRVKEFGILRGCAETIELRSIHSAHKM